MHQEEPPLGRLDCQYESSQRNRWNQLTHTFGIPPEALSGWRSLPVVTRRWGAKVTGRV